MGQVLGELFGRATDEEADFVPWDGGGSFTREAEAAGETPGYGQNDDGRSAERPFA
jgi:hypothetical protein